MRRLLLDTVTRETCPKSVHKLLGLPSSDDAAMIGPQAGLARVSGRWLVQECADQGDDSGHSFALGGPGWMWIDQTLKGVRIHQYVYFFARASITGSLDVAYDESARVASVWLTQTAAPTLAFTPFSGADAQVQNPLARVLGSAFPSGADSTASTSAEARMRVQSTDTMAQ